MNGTECSLILTLFWRKTAQLTSCNLQEALCRFCELVGMQMSFVTVLYGLLCGFMMCNHVLVTISPPAKEEYNLKYSTSLLFKTDASAAAPNCILIFKCLHNCNTFIDLPKTVCTKRYSVSWLQHWIIVNVSIYSLSINFYFFFSWRKVRKIYNWKKLTANMHDDYITLVLNTSKIA